MGVLAKFIDFMEKEGVAVSTPSLPLNQLSITGTNRKSIFIIRMAKKPGRRAVLDTHLSYPLFPAPEGYSFVNTYEEGLPFVFGDDPWKFLDSKGVTLTAQATSSGEGTRFGGWDFAFTPKNNSLESMQHANAACEQLHQYFLDRKNTIDLGISIAFDN